MDAKCCIIIIIIIFRHYCLVLQWIEHNSLLSSNLFNPYWLMPWGVDNDELECFAFHMDNLFGKKDGLITRLRVKRNVKKMDKAIEEEENKKRLEFIDSEGEEEEEDEEIQEIKQEGGMDALEALPPVGLAKPGSIIDMWNSAVENGRIPHSTYFKHSRDEVEEALDSLQGPFGPVGKTNITDVVFYDDKDEPSIVVTASAITRIIWDADEVQRYRTEQMELIAIKERAEAEVRELEHSIEGKINSQKIVLYFFFFLS